MKNTMVIVVGICWCALFGGGYSALSQNEEVAGENINFVNVPVSRVLDIYKTIARMELVVATNVRDTHGITVRTEKPMTKDAAAKLIEEALLKQAGVVITRLDSKRTSVTYNDKLELQQ